MLKIVKIEQLPAKLIREVTDVTTSVVLIDYHLTTGEENEEPSSVPLHWQGGDWSKPPINISLDDVTGHLRGLELLLQDETIEHKMLLGTALADLPSDRGIPVFDLTPWSNDDWYVNETLPPMLSWDDENNLVLVFLPPPVRVAKTCVVDDFLTFLLNEQNEIIGFQVNQITHEEKSIIRSALLRNTPGRRSDPSKTVGFE